VADQLLKERANIASVQQMIEELWLLSLSCCSIVNHDVEMINKTFFKKHDMPDIPKYTAMKINTGHLNNDASIKRISKCNHNTEDIMWLVDSGASEHFTGFIEDFIDYKAFPFPLPAATANGITHILGQGSVYIKHKPTHGKEQIIVLNPVQYLPSASFRLVSNGRLCKQGLIAVQDESSITFSLRGSKNPLLEGYPLTKDDNLNWITTRIVKDTNEIKKGITTLQVKVDYDTWHKRMGHPSLDILKKAPENLKGFPKDLKFESKEPVCPGCAQGKAHARSYPQSDK
jgi:hypothetical protein